VNKKWLQWGLVVGALWFFQPMPTTDPQGQVHFVQMYVETTRAQCEQDRKDYYDAFRDNYDKGYRFTAISPPCQLSH
jgi:hypothetical protein